MLLSMFFRSRFYLECAGKLSVLLGPCSSPSADDGACCDALTAIAFEWITRGISDCIIQHGFATCFPSVVSTRSVIGQRCVTRAGGVFQLNSNALEVLALRQRIWTAHLSASRQPDGKWGLEIPIDATPDPLEVASHPELGRLL